MILSKKKLFIINKCIILFERNSFQYIIHYSKELNDNKCDIIQYSIYDVSYVCINKSLTMRSTFCDKKEKERL